jgi:MFS family permease
MAAALAEIGGADRAGSAIGLTLTALFGASAIGPIVFGAIADHTSLDTAWTVNACIGVLGVIPAIWLSMNDRRKQAA